MNYRHAYHAGNFADVMKHAVLALVIQHLNRKETPYRVIDTHAGLGVYDLSQEKASKTGEWRDGIGRLTQASLSPEIAALLQPYLAVVEETRGDLGSPMLYPGSPEIARRLTRAQDRMIFVEKHPRDVLVLQQSIKGDKRAKALELDGWTALRANVPPKEKRGLVLIDPPFEDPDEFQRMASAAIEAWRKWRTGVYMLWYPIKAEHDGDALAAALQEAGIDKRLRIELIVRAATGEGKLRGSGLMLINPPWTLAADARRLLPELAAHLAPGGKAQWRCDETAQPLA
jgi:23S rRNA (adenine2030-N6)-methyltransferase